MNKQEILNTVKSLNSISKDTKIVIIMGGQSAEREVSLRSGKNCLNALIELGYNNTISLDMDDQISENLTKINPEIVFIMLHGTYGEDGYIQGILEKLNIPYTGSGVTASALCMDKRKTKKVLKSKDIPCPKTYENIDNSISWKYFKFQVSNFSKYFCYATRQFFVSMQDTLQPKTNKVAEQKTRKHYKLKLKTLPQYPVFCKPTDQGSSLGAGIVNDKTELDEKIKKIKEYSSEPALIEEFINGRELTVGVLQVKDEIFATDILEIRVKNGEYDYDNKYTPGALEFSCPAEIDTETTDRIKNLVIQSFKATNCSGFARVDVILQENSPYIIEINTIPGMTDTSDLPYQSNTFGINNKELVNLILHSALIEKDR